LANERVKYSYPFERKRGSPSDFSPDTPSCASYTPHSLFDVHRFHFAVIDLDSLP